MTELTQTTLVPRKLHPLRIVASVLYLVSAVLLLIQLVITGTFQNYFANLASLGEAFEYGVTFGIINLHYFLLLPIAVLGPIAIAAIGLVVKKAIWQPVLGAALFVVIYVLSWILQAIAVVSGQFTRIYFSPYGDLFLPWLAMVLLVLAVVISGGAWLSSKSSSNAITPTSGSLDSVALKAPAIVPVTRTGSLENLPLFALIGAFVIPLAGVILGHLSLSYIKKGQLGEQNKSMALAGLIIGYVLIGFTLVVGLVFVLLLVASAAVRY